MRNQTYYRPTMAKINLKTIQQNVKLLRAYLGCKTTVIAVVKADGYGHGEVEVAKAVFEGGARMVSGGGDNR